MSNLRDIDQVPANLEPKLRGLLRSLREHVRSLAGLDGQGNRVILTEDAVQEIVSEAVANLPGAGGGGGTAPEYIPDLTAPPTPSSVVVTAGLTNIFIETANPTFSEGHGYARTIVYGKQWEVGQPDPVFSGAVKVHEFVGSVGSFTVRPGAKWSLWLKWLTEDGVESTAPSGGTNGHVAEAGKIGNADLGDLIVEAGNLAAGAVTAAKFGAGIEPVTIITAASLPTTKSTNAIYWSDKLYRWNGTAYVATVPTTDLSGQVADAQIEGLAASKVTGQLSDSQIAAVAAAKLTGQIVGTQITDGAISTAKLSAGSVTTAVLAADAVTADKIAANAVTASEIAAGAVTTAKLAAGAVTANEIAAGAIITGKLAAGAVTANELAADAVTAGKIQAGAITANKLAANAIAVGTAAIENGAISNAMIANAAIDDAKIANLSADKLTAGDGTIGGNLKSATYSAELQQGWMVRPDGFAEFNDIVVRGTVFASAGDIGGSLIGSNYIQSTNWTNLTTGWRLNNDGTGQVGGIAILSDRIQSGNYSVNAQGFAWRADGTGQIGGLKVTATGIESSNFVPGTSGFQITYDGNMFARGNIEATSLKVDAANIVRTIHLQDQAVTVPVAGQYSGGGSGTNRSPDTDVLTLPSTDFGGGKVSIAVFADIQSNSGIGDMIVRVRRGSTEISQRYVLGQSEGVIGGGYRGQVCFVLQDSPGAGSHTYSVRVGNPGGANILVYDIGVILIGSKK